MSPQQKHARAKAWLAAAVEHEGDECLIWPFGRGTHGYGKIYWSGRHDLAHRVVCERVHGSAPTAAHLVAHTCGKGHEGCRNPRHLRWATRKENLADRVAHGTPRFGERHPMAKLSARDVAEIRAALARGRRGKDLAGQYEVSPNAISRIKNGQTWSSPC